LTIIALQYLKGTFLCLADTRVSRPSNNGKPRSVTDYFPKLGVLPIKWGCGEKDQITFGQSELGIAFSGNVTNSSAVYNLALNTLQNLYTISNEELPPKLEDIAEHLRTLIQVIFDDTKAELEMGAVIDTFLFGYCPRSKIAEAFQVGCLPLDTGWATEATKLQFQDYSTFAMGSGSKLFWDLKHKLHAEGNKVPFEKAFVSFVQSGVDPACGGSVNALEADANSVSLKPMLLPIDDGRDFEVFICGILWSDLGSVSNYSIGRNFIGIGIEDVTNRGWLKKLGYDPDGPEINSKIKNLAAMQGVLTAASREKAKVQLSSDLTVEKISPEKGKWYFSTVCQACYLFSPLLVDPSNGSNLTPFYEVYKISSTCTHCGENCSSPANELRSRVW
jgi:hypothetical protein